MTDVLTTGTSNDHREDSSTTDRSALSLHVDELGIARLTIDLPGEKVNKLSSPIMRDFAQKIEKVSAMTEVKALVIQSGKANIFIAGADINEIKDIQDTATAIEVVVAIRDRVNSASDSLIRPSV